MCVSVQRNALVCSCVCVLVCVCVDEKINVYIYIHISEAAGEHRSHRPTKTLQCSCVNVSPSVYLYIVLPLGAYKSQLGGLMVYCCWFILSMTPVILYIYNM